jgi:chemotaxis protein methyltransferase CheR
VLGLELTPQLFALFSTLVEEASGLHYSPADRELLSTKLGVHATELGYDTLLDYYYRLRYDDPDGGELARLVEALVVHETYFFRELPPLVTIADGHVTEVVRSRGRARVWSAAAATGEEPYTFAMLLAERGLLDKVEIVATDISRVALERAKTGRHGRRSVRDGHPAALAAKYLDVTATGVTVAPAIRRAVEFSRVNLFDDAAVAALGMFDVILCRNVLIYFDDRNVAKVIVRIASQLAPDGILVVGVSESLLRFGTMLACEERGGSFLYRRAR